MGRPRRILIVDLSNRTHWVEDLGEEVLRLYLGGRGLGARLLARFLPEDADPLGDANPLLFVAGPLQGTESPFGSKIVLTTKSPLTGGYLFSVASGTLGHHLARCGFTALVIIGSSEEPVYLWIDDGGVDFRKAASLWGKPVTETYRVLREEVAVKGFGAAMIGPAGEKLVRYAAVITELPRKRSFGRGGGGAVMGAKQLKAIAIADSSSLAVADKDRFRAARRAQVRAVVAKRWFRDQRMAFGTTTSMAHLQEFGMLPTRNWQRGSFEGYEQIAPTEFGERWAGESHPCAPFCPAPCARAYRFITEDDAVLASEGPDYETIYALGANCGIDRFDAIVAMDHLCDEMGMDTISAGVTIGFIMECFERGLLNEDDTGGLRLDFGDHQRVLEALEMIAARKGFGDTMAEGVRHCAAYVGQGSDAFAMHARGLEFGGWGCRAAYGQALQFALSSRGGCHHDLGLPAKAEWGSPEATSTEGKGRLVLDSAARRIVRDSAIQCSFAGLYFGLDLLVDLLEAITGLPWSEDDAVRLGERILNLERLLNVREGIDRTLDRLPTRLLAQPLADGPMRGSTIPLEDLKDDFYAVAGWDRATGRPTLETVRRLHLDQEIVETYAHCLAVPSA